MAAPSRSAAPSPSESAGLEEAVETLTGEVRTLAQQVEVLRIAIDDLRSELEFAIRNMPREPWVPVHPLTSMPKDPLAEPFPVNRTRREDVVSTDKHTSQPPSPTVLPRTESAPPAVPQPASSKKRKQKAGELF